MYACFISYRHPGDEGAQKIIEAFLKELKTQICLYIPQAKVYFDNERLKGGTFFNEELATELCKSGCMILLFSPYYFDTEHCYCSLEYKAMAKLERERLNLAPEELRHKGLIIPVVIRGEPQLPDEIKNNRHCFILNLLAATDFKRRSFKDKVREIAEEVFERYRTFKPRIPTLIKGCDEFQFPNKDEIMPWLEEVLGMKPEQPMPGAS